MPLINIAPKLAPEEYERNFRDIKPPLTLAQARVEAARCLFCFDAPCIHACPTRIDVPSFIRKITTGNLTGSARVILSANILGESCGRVCPTEVLCEGACVLTREGLRPVEIGALQRYAVDDAFDRGVRFFRAGEPNGLRVAAIGSGPASLACAAELAQRGCKVVIFDRKWWAGGLNTYGIAAYKTRAADSLREVRMVEELGVEFRQGVEVGRDVSLGELEREFDAIFIGVGLGETRGTNLPGEHLAGVVGALTFIECTKREPFEQIDVGRRVVVIGAGNTAIDVATAAHRLGAEEVTILYRRGERDLPAYHYEYELAERDRVAFRWHTQPVRILGSSRVEGVECVRTRVVGDGRRARVETIAGSEFVLAADMVVPAIGQEPHLPWLRSIPGLELRGLRLEANQGTGQTGNPKYFAGGDCVNGGREVVDAVAEGMRAARGIYAWLAAREHACSERSL